VVACSFSQRQGYVSIDRADGVRHELKPQGAAGHYLDDQGRKAVRRKGLGSKGQIYRLATESVYVYWDTAGLPGSSQPKPAGAVPAVLPPLAPPPVPFEQTLQLQGIQFQVSSANGEGGNQLRIVPRGLTVDNTPILRPIAGQVTRAEVADLNADGSPELYVYIRSAAAGSPGALQAFGANRGKSLSEIFLPPIGDDTRAARGYRGEDDFAVVENTLVRRFPVYREGDATGAPTGGVRQLQYKLHAGEASWQLKLERVVDY
jgi:hypothetical protein